MQWTAVPVAGYKVTAELSLFHINTIAMAQAHSGSTAAGGEITANPLSTPAYEQIIHTYAPVRASTPASEQITPTLAPSRASSP